MSVALPTLCCATAYVGNAATAGTAVHVPWEVVSPPRERAALDRWAAAVGGPVLSSPGTASRPSSQPLTIVSWNTHVGGGDIEALWSRVASNGPVVMLLQEVYRAGMDVPAQPPANARWAAHQGPSRPDGSREDIVATARRLGAWLFYVPSMRNGMQQEDRGSAILSSIPLRDPVAIELPLERQRRVAVEAIVDVTVHGSIVPLHLVSTHFTNMVANRLWILSEPGRMRQARALARLLAPQQNVVLGGDLNSWFGFYDAAYRELAHVFPGPRPRDARPTFGPMRLDHLFFKLPGQLHPEIRRADSRFGSDHYPLTATVS